MAFLQQFHAPSPITFQAVSEDNLDALLDLALGPGQEAYVASVAVSLAQAFVYSEAWPRAIMAGDVVVGFLMLSMDKDAQKVSTPPKIGVWRLIIDAQFQGLGYGAMALKLACGVAAEYGARSLWLSCVPGEDGPEAFYKKQGFVPTGELDEDGEVILSLKI